MANDRALGLRIHQHLTELGLETPMQEQHIDRCCNGSAEEDGVRRMGRFNNVRDGFQKIMYNLGLDLEDDSLHDTPKRMAKMYCNEVFQGLDFLEFPACTTVENKMQYQEMVCVRNIEVKTMCEHHLVPFIGGATIAYIPNKKVLGLSKFNRVVDFFCRRPQIQERLTEQVSAALRMILETEDVAVVIKAKHFCVHLRGVEDSCSDTVTSRIAGKFRSESDLRAEFLALTRD